jgi:hypothetical protein
MGEVLPAVGPDVIHALQWFSAWAKSCGALPHGFVMDFGRASGRNPECFVVSRKSVIAAVGPLSSIFSQTPRHSSPPKAKNYIISIENGVFLSPPCSPSP